MMKTIIAKREDAVQPIGAIKAIRNRAASHKFFNSGKVYMNWVSKPSSDDCIYVIERSIDGTEYEPVGLKEGIGSPLELLYSWVDTKPVTGITHYRIKQIDNEGKLVAQADPKSVMSPETSPLFIDKSTRMVQVK